MQSLSPKEAFRSISVFYYALIGGMLIFTLIVFAFNFFQPPLLPDKSLERIFLVVVLFMAALLITIALRLYDKQLAEIRSRQAALMTRLEMYRTALVLFMALCEGAGLFAVIVYFLTANKLLLIVIAVVLLVMLQKRPEKFRIFNELQLSSEEQSELN